MKSSISDTLNDRQRLASCLHNAARQLLIARSKRDAIIAIELSLGICCCASVVCCGLIIGVRFWAWPGILLTAWVATSAGLIVGVVLWTSASSLRIRPTLSQVAERLDLANNTCNSFATAEEFLRSGVDTAFEKAAVAQGLRRLDDIRLVPPLFSSRSFHVGRCATLFSTSAMLILGAFFLPKTFPLIVTAASGVGVSKNVLFVMANASDPKKKESAATLSTPHSPAPGASASRAGNRPIGSSIHTDLAPAGTADSAAVPVGSDAVAAATAMGQPNANTAGEPSSAMVQTGAGFLSRSEAPRPDQSVAPSDTGAKGVAARTKAAGGSRSKPVPSAGGNSQKSPPSSGGGSSSNAAPPPPDSPPEKADGAGVGAGVETDQPIPDSSGASPMPTHSNDAGGDGKTLGQSQPKKSRGVAPLLLGTRQPDLFRGRPLAGPDERTRTQLPATRDPSDPALPAAAADRTGDERAVSSYQIPADLEGVVGQYFQMFHDKADTLAVSTTKRN